MSPSGPRPPRWGVPRGRGGSARARAGGGGGRGAAVGSVGERAAAPLPLPTFTAVCAAVQEGRAAGAVLPLENSLGGTVGEAVDALLHTELPVLAEPRLHA